MAEGEVVGQATPEQERQWLEEQRRRQREQTEGDTREIQRLAQHGRDLETRLAALEDEVAQQRSLVTRALAVETALRHTQESLANLQRQLAESREQVEHQALLRATEAERDRRALAELGQRVTDLQQAADASHGRVSALSEEARRDRAALAQLSVAVDGVAGRQASLTNRLQQLEEAGKRADSHLASDQQRDEQVRADLARLDNWQRLADVRWNRQLSDWQEQAKAWKEQIEEQRKPVEQLSRQVSRVQEEAQVLVAQLTEHQKRLDEQALVLQRIEGLLGIARETCASLEQGIESQRRLADEQAAALSRLDERVQGESVQLEQMRRRMDAQDGRIEEAVGLVRAVDSQRQRAEEGVAALQQQLARLRSELVAELALLREQVTIDRQEVGARLNKITQTQLQEHRRRLATTQQEVDEWAGLARRDGDGKLPDRTPE